MNENKTIRVCVIDDEPIACRRIQRLLKEDPEVEVLDVCSDGESAAEALRHHQPDLIFLDIQMPGLDGFEVLESLSGPAPLPHVIFVTAHHQYAIRAFEIHALDYLLKPFDRKRFASALKRGKSQIRQEHFRTLDRELLFSFLKDLRMDSNHLHRILIKSMGKVFFLKTDQIDWIEAQGKYALIHAGQDTYLIREGMNSLEKQLDPNQFLRIHKSNIVNLDRIEHLQPLFHGDYRVFLRSGSVLTVSRRYRQKMDELFGKPL